MSISIFNNDFLLRLREVYDDYRINEAVIRQGYNVDYPYIMDLYDDDMEVIKSINVQMMITMVSSGIHMSIYDDYGRITVVSKNFI